MTDKQIQDQIDAIRKATETACQSKESAIKFLTDAGIISKQVPSTVEELGNVITQVLKNTPLTTRLYIQFIMSDYDNWKNGEYLGDTNKIKQEVNHTIDKIQKWINDGMPGGFRKLDNQPTIPDVGAVAVEIAENITPKLSAQEQAMFISGFQECIKWQLSQK